MLENIAYVGLGFADVLLGLEAAQHFTACKIKDKSIKPCLYKQIGILKQKSKAKDGVEWHMNKLATRVDNRSIITKLIEDCYNESDVDNKTQILYKVNSLLPKMCRINIPSLITDDYVDTALFQIEKSTHC